MFVVPWLEQDTGLLCSSLWTLAAVFLALFVLVLGGCVVAVIRVAVQRILRNFSPSWQKLLSLPGPAPHWLTGNLGELQKGYSKVHLLWRKEFGETYKVHFGPMTLALFTSDPVLIREVCMTAFKFFHDRPISPYTFVRREGLLTGRGSYWAGVRSAVAPLFHSHKLQNFGTVMHRQASILINKLQRVPEGEAVELVDLLSAFTFDVIGEAAFGIEFGQQSGGNKQDLARVIKETLMEGTRFRASVIVAMLFPALKPLAQRFFACFPGSADRKQFLRWEYITRECLSIVRSRRQDPKADTYNDFLTLLTKAREKGSKRPLTDSEVRTLVFEFLVAGSETTANTLSFAIASIAQHPQVEAKMIKEIDRLSCSCSAAAAGKKKRCSRRNNNNNAASQEAPKEQEEEEEDAPPPSAQRLERAGARNNFFCSSSSPSSSSSSSSSSSPPPPPPQQQHQQQKQGSTARDCLHPAVADLSKYTYVQQVLQETLRMYPVAGFLLRETQQDCVVGSSSSSASNNNNHHHHHNRSNNTNGTFGHGRGSNNNNNNNSSSSNEDDGGCEGGIPLKKGVCVGVPVYALHHDPANYPRPEAFRPERFDPESDELKQRKPNTYLPFGLGPHMCVGHRFAMDEGMLALIRLYQRFTFRLVRQQQQEHPPSGGPASSAAGAGAGTDGAEEEEKEAVPQLELTGSGSLLRLKEKLWVTVHPRHHQQQQQEGPLPTTQAEEQQCCSCGCGA